MICSAEIEGRENSGKNGESQTRNCVLSDGSSIFAIVQTVRQAARNKQKLSLKLVEVGKEIVLSIMGAAHIVLVSISLLITLG